MRQVAAGARQTVVARARGISPALLGRWQRAALAQAVPSGAEREEIKRLRTELKRLKRWPTKQSCCLTRAGMTGTRSGNQ